MAAVQVPEYSPARPETTARQAPVHPTGAFAADHAPSARVLPFASTSAHVPVTVPAVSSIAVHVPMSVRPLLVAALHEPARSPGALVAVSGRTTDCARDGSAAARNSPPTRNNPFPSTSLLPM